MLKKLLRRLQFNKKRLKTGKDENKKRDRPSRLSASLQANLASLKDLFNDAADFKIRDFKIGTGEQIEAALLFIDGLVDKSTIDRDILRPLLIEVRLTSPQQRIRKKDRFSLIKNSLASAESKEADTFDEVVDAVLSGETALLVDGFPTALIAGTRGFETRGVQEPLTEAVVRGPREGFSENLRTNTTLLRRKIKNPNLKFINFSIGQQTRTRVCIVFLAGIANEKIVEEVKTRLARIETDAILESGYIEQYIEDAPFSLFPTISNSEKPDVIAGKLLEGRVAVLVDGTPFALCVPYLFLEAFQVSEDYYSRPYYTTVIRMLRLIAFFTTLLLPAAYVAATTFHQEIFPTTLLITLAAAREGTPFPAVVEALLMGIIFEILREAGVRLPRPVGQAVSIVGALVIGENAVAAGLIGAPMVMVIALTAISSFVIPALGDAIPVLRVLFVLLAGALGHYGIVLGLTALLIHLCSLRSFGVPYLSPFAPAAVSDLKDTVLRVPLWAMLSRPRVIGWKNPARQKPGLRPAPPAKKR